MTAVISAARRQRAPPAPPPPEAEGTADEPVDEPLEPDGHLHERAPEPGDHTVDHAAAHDRLADTGLRRPLRPVSEKVGDGDGEIGVWVQETDTPGHDAVPVVVSIARPG